MACFIVPAAEAVVTTIATKIIEKNENKKSTVSLVDISNSNKSKCKFSKKIKRLNYMLWGGSALLAFEHLWHGEIQPFFPFLTAAGDSTEYYQMLNEMSTVGVGMALAVTAVWGIVTIIIDKISKNNFEYTSNSSSEKV